MWREQLKDEIRGWVLFDAPLSPFTSFGIGGPADALVFPKDIEDLKAALAIARGNGIPFFPMGGGTNLLVRDKGIKGLVINLSRSFNGIRVKGGEVIAGGGTRLSRLLEVCTQEGLAGLEFLSRIPGTVGGAVKGNAGAWGRSTGDFLTRVRVLDGKENDRYYMAGELEFSYRRSSLSTDEVIVEAAFSLKTDDPCAILKRSQEFSEKRAKQQPLMDRSAGSIFKNPPDDYAGRLIEESGLKGLRQGNAQIFPTHANFIVNLGGATANDVLLLIDLARERVRQETGIELELEIQVVGEE